VALPVDAPVATSLGTIPLLAPAPVVFAAVVAVAAAAAEPATPILARKLSRHRAAQALCASGFVATLMVIVALGVRRAGDRDAGTAAIITAVPRTAS
jgi:hypothetical protein